MLAVIFITLTFNRHWHSVVSSAFLGICPDPPYFYGFASFDIGSVSLGMWLAFLLYKMWLALLLYLETVYASLLFIILIIPINVYHDGGSSSGRFCP